MPIETSQIPDQLKGLEREISTFRSHLDKFLGSDQKGKFVLIQGHNVIGFYGSYSAAAKIGYARFGTSKPFLVQQIEPEESIHYFPILNEQADPAAH
jgi:hypothetical protein